MKRADMLTQMKDTKMVATDQETEEGVLPLGEVYHISTVQFAYRGKLVVCTPSYYVLEDASNVFDTGALETYRHTKIGQTEERWGKVLVERGAVTAIWTFK